MTTLTSTQRQTLQQIAEATRPLAAHEFNSTGALFFNGDSSKIYAPSAGLNGAALRALVKTGMIEQSTQRFYEAYYCLTEAGKEVL